MPQTDKRKIEKVIRTKNIKYSAHQNTQKQKSHQTSDDKPLSSMKESNLTFRNENMADDDEPDELIVEDLSKRESWRRVKEEDKVEKFTKLNTELSLGTKSDKRHFRSVEQPGERPVSQMTSKVTVIGPTGESSSDEEGEESESEYEQSEHQSNDRIHASSVSEFDYVEEVQFELKRNYHQR